MATYHCRWDFCPRMFTSIEALKHHFSHYHVPREEASYVPTSKRRQRNDGGWEVVSEGAAAFGTDLLQGALDASISITTLSTLSSTSAPSFVVPSLPPPFHYSQDANGPIAGVLGSTGILAAADEPAAAVDYDAFLRSPSPVSTSQPMYSTPFSQIPLESQPQQSAVPAPPAPGTSQTQADHTGTSVVSSAQHVSPARGSFVTQVIPPPSATPSSQRTASSADTNSPSSIQISFGAAAGGPGGTPARRVSASGFSWGMGKK